MSVSHGAREYICNRILQVYIKYHTLIKCIDATVKQSRKRCFWNSSFITMLCKKNFFCSKHWLSFFKQLRPGFRLSLTMFVVLLFHYRLLVLFIYIFCILHELLSFALQWVFILKIHFISRESCFQHMHFLHVYMIVLAQ